MRCDQQSVNRDNLEIGVVDYVERLEVRSLTKNSLGPQSNYAYFLSLIRKYAYPLVNVFAFLLK